MNHVLCAVAFTLLTAIAQPVLSCPLATQYGLPADKGAGAVLCDPANQMPAPLWRYDLHKGVEDIPAVVVPLPDTTALVLGYAQDDQEPIGWALRLDVSGVNRLVGGGDYALDFLRAAAFHPAVGLVAVQGRDDAALLDANGAWITQYDFGSLSRNEARAINDAMFSPDGHLFVMGAERDSFGTEHGFWDLRPDDHRDAFMTELDEGIAGVKLLRVTSDRDNIVAITAYTNLAGTQAHAIDSIDWQGNTDARAHLSDYGRYLDAVALPNGGYAVLMEQPAGARWFGAQMVQQLVLYDAGLQARDAIPLTDPAPFHATAMMAAKDNSIVLAGHLSLDTAGLTLRRPGLLTVMAKDKPHRWRGIDLDADVHFTQIAETTDARIILAGMRGTAGAEARDTDAVILSWRLEALGFPPPPSVTPLGTPAQAKP